MYTYVYIISASKCKGLKNELKSFPDFVGVSRLGLRTSRMALGSQLGLTSDNL